MVNPAAQTVPRRRRRKFTRSQQARRILGSIWRHPSNRGQRLRSVVRTVGWQMQKKLLGTSREIQLKGGTRLKCYPDSNSASNLIYFSGAPDFDEMAFVSRYLGPGDGFIDCGANIGTYTLLAASCVGPGGRVVCFEPLRANFDRLQENVRLNQFTQVEGHCLAVADVAGVLQFTTDWDVSNRLASSRDLKYACAEVSVDRLDNLLPTDRRFQLAKLDVEGAEVRALLGAQRLLAEHNPPVWLFEATEFLLDRQGASRQQLIRLFLDHGYRIAS